MIFAKRTERIANPSYCMLFIQGRAVDLSSKHTQLNDKYTAKYKQ